MPTVVEADTREEIEDARELDNEDNALPVAGVKDGVTITSPPGSPGWTMRVRRVRHCKDGRYRYRISQRRAQRILDARAIPAPQRTPRQRRLARLPVPTEVLESALEETNQ